jgi:uncharacterized membrane protein YidH (DUF202 family)
VPDRDRPEPPDDIEDRDPGLARERTDLAWTRTAISFAALGAAMLHISAVAGMLVLGIAVAVWGLGQLSAQGLRPGGHPRRLTPRRTVQLVTVVTTSMSVLALILALTVTEGVRL